MLDFGRPLINERAIEKNVAPSKKEKEEEAQEELVGLKESKEVNLITLFSSVILVLFIGMAVALFLAKLSRTSTLNNKQEAYNRLEQQLNSKELKDTDKQVQALTKGLKKAQSILEGRVSYKLILSTLSSLIPAGVQLNDLKIDEKLEVKISGTADSYDSVALFVANLSGSEIFSNVSLTDVINSGITTQNSAATTPEITSATIKFSLQANINAEKLKKSNSQNSQVKSQEPQ